METRANHILIGAFLLLAVMAGFAFLFWMQNYGAGASVRRYNILFKGPVTGLGPASSVLFNGLKVGRIEDFIIDPKDPRNTLVRVAIRRNIPVRRNSYARIVSQGLSAYSAIMITPGTPDEQLLSAAGEGQLPLIKAAPGGAISSLFEAAPEVLSEARNVLRRIDELVANNEQLVRASLKNVEAFTRELKNNKDHLASLMQNADKTVRKAGEASEKISRLLDSNSRNIGKTIKAIAATSQNAEKFSAMLAAKRQDVAAIIDNVRALSDRFGKIADKLEASLDGLSGLLSDKNGQSVITEVRGAATSFRQLADKLNKSLGESSKSMAYFAKNGLREFEGLMRDGRRMVRSVEKLTNSLERNPQGLIFGGKQVRQYKSN